MDSIYENWHRRNYPEQYLWENCLFPEIVQVDSCMQCKILINLFNSKYTMLSIEGSKLTSTHIMTIQKLINDQKAFEDKIREGVFKYYRYVLPDYGYDPDDIRGPKLKDHEINKIDKLIRLTSIHCAEIINEGYLGLCFSCSWDEEHGLGIRLRNYEIEIIGGSDIGFSLHPDSSDEANL